MEIASIVTSSMKLETNLLNYLLKLPSIYFAGEDDDKTYYFENNHGRNELYLFLDNDIQYEFNINFTEKDVDYIKAFFIEKKLYLIDVAFRNHKIFLKLIEEALNELLKLGLLKQEEVIIDDPFRGLLILNDGNLQEV